jgi:hypothetical protein
MRNFFANCNDKNFSRKSVQLSASLLFSSLIMMFCLLDYVYPPTVLVTENEFFILHEYAKLLSSLSHETKRHGNIPAISGCFTFMKDNVCSEEYFSGKEFLSHENYYSIRLGETE